MANKLNVQVVVGLVDRLSAPLKGLQAKLRRAGADLSMMGQGTAMSPAGRAIAPRRPDRCRRFRRQAVLRPHRDRHRRRRPRQDWRRRRPCQIASPGPRPSHARTPASCSPPWTIRRRAWTMPWRPCRPSAIRRPRRPVLTDMPPEQAAGLIQNLYRSRRHSCSARSTSSPPPATRGPSSEGHGPEFPSRTAATAKLGLTGEKAVATLDRPSRWP